MSVSAPSRSKAPSSCSSCTPSRMLRASGGSRNGKPLDVAEPQCRHLQDHRGEVGAQDLRVGVARARREVVLGVQPDADAGRHATGATGPLRGRRLRDRFDRQPLHLRPPAVARDARGAGVDDVADARHGQRCLGDVGGQHDAPPGVRREHPLLLGGRQPRVQRQHLGVARVRAPRSASAVSRISRSPDRKTRTSPGGSAASSRTASTIASVWSRSLGAHDFVVGVVGVVARLSARSYDFQWAVTDLDRIGAAGHLDDRAPHWIHVRHRRSGRRIAPARWSPT